MNILFGWLLLIVTIMYTVRIFALIMTLIGLIRKKTRFSYIRAIMKMKQNVRVFLWGGILEHGFIYLSLIGSCYYLFFGL